MEALQSLGKLREYKNKICKQYSKGSETVTIIDYTHTYPIIHCIQGGKSRMAYFGGHTHTTVMGRNNQNMVYDPFFPTRSVIILTHDPILKECNLHPSFCKYPTLWIKEALELGYSIRDISSRISWQDSIDKSQHLIKGLGLSTKSFRVFMKCPNYFTLWNFKLLLSLGYSTQFIENHRRDIADITLDEVYDKECVDYIFSNLVFNYNPRFQNCWYRDYVKMRNQLPTHIKRNWPKCPNLTKHSSDKWHSLIMVEFNKHRAQIELAKSQQKQSQYFEEVYPKAKEFEFADEVYQVTAPKMVTSLLEEGRVLHHCVGSYVDSVAAGKEYILYLRKVAEPDTPFFTINLLPNGEVRQIHGLCNCNVPKELKPFIDKWAKQFELNVKSCNGVYWHL
jgi:hypothetical protein